MLLALPLLHWTALLHLQVKLRLTPAELLLLPARLTCSLQLQLMLLLPHQLCQQSGELPQAQLLLLLLEQLAARVLVREQMKLRLTQAPAAVLLLQPPSSGQLLPAGLMLLLPQLLLLLLQLQLYRQKGDLPKAVFVWLAQIGARVITSQQVKL